MGTNFYWLGHRGEYSIKHHIGKRSAAGPYCFDCGTTLCAEGASEVHSGGWRSEPEWSDACPSCGQEPAKLGETECSNPTPSGVRPACSFTWTLLKHKREIEALRDHPKSIIVDEYGKHYTAAQFLDELRFCPIEFQSPREFS